MEMATVTVSDVGIDWRRFFPDGITFGFRQETDFRRKPITRYFKKDRTAVEIMIEEIDAKEFFKD